MSGEKFMDVVKRLKVLVASASALMLVALFFAVGGPGRLMSSPTSDAPDEPAQEVLKIEDPLEYFRTDRKAVRQTEIEQLTEIVDGESTSAENRAAAQRRIIDLTDWMEKEMTIENVLRARGFEDVVATVHTDSVNVLIRAEAVSQSDSAVILELVMRETGIAGGNIKIIPIN